MTSKPRPPQQFPTALAAGRRSKTKVVDEIIESIRQDIVTRRLSRGARLPSEKELSVRFGVSQPTVREAIRALDTLGLIEVLHGNGSFVRGEGEYALASALQTLLQLKSVGILEVLDVRQILGRFSIERAAMYANAEDIKAIEAVTARFDNLAALEEVDDVIALIIEFQRSVSAASHNPLLHSLETFLATLLLEVQVIALQGRNAHFWRKRASEFQSYRLDILAGLRNHDANAARDAMNSYFDAQRSRFEKDAILSEIDLSNPNLISGIATMVQYFKK